MRNRFLRFLTCKTGNFALMTALGFLPVVLSAGIAIDYAAALSQRNALQAAADAAVLYAASSGTLDRGTLAPLVENVFKANLTPSLAGIAQISEFDVGADKRITLKVRAVSPTSLARIIKPDGIALYVLSQAQAGSDDKIEVALVLDNTYSMSGQKLTDLKSASGALLDVFERIDKDKSKIKVALIPFSRYVNVGMSNRNAAWMSVQDDYSTTQNVCSTSKPVVSQSDCTTVTKTGYNDGVPYTYKQTTCQTVVYGDPVTTCADKTTNYKWTGCVGSRKSPYDVIDTTGDIKYTGLLNTGCGAAITPLTNDFTALRSAIKAMVANNETYIAPGLLWGWNALSPTEPFAQGLAYDADVKKFIVIMTDGTNTVSPSYPYHTGTSVSKSDSLMATLCTNAKNKDVTIFTVAVGIEKTSSTAVELGKCASSSDKSLLVTDSSKLTAAFEEIANQIMSPRLTM